MPPTVVPLDNPVQNYAWGSHTAIADLLGRPAPAGRPEAELWVGAHPHAPSRVATAGGPPTLDALIRSAPDSMLGPETARRWGGELPLLMKVIAAAQPLSIQCHPNEAQARDGFARENAAGLPLDSPRRSYRDPHHKPELVAALTRFVGLKGVREVAAIRRALGAVDVPAGRAIDGGLAAALRDLEAPEGPKRLFAWLWSRPDDERRRLVGAAVAASTHPPDDDPAWPWLERLQARYPGDVGVLAPLLLNLIDLRPEEALFLPAGELHAYLEGTAVEVMASSDNVLRGGLTPKHVDVEALLAVGVFRPSPPEVLRPVALAPAERVYRTPAREFELGFLQVEPGAPFSSAARPGPELLLGLEGTATIAADGGSWPLGRGASVFVPATVAGYRIEGRARISRARIPR